MSTQMVVGELMEQLKQRAPSDRVTVAAHDLREVIESRARWMELAQRMEEERNKLRESATHATREWSVRFIVVALAWLYTFGFVLGLPWEALAQVWWVSKVLLGLSLGVLLIAGVQE